MLPERNLEKCFRCNYNIRDVVLNNCNHFLYCQFCIQTKVEGIGICNSGKIPRCLFYMRRPNLIKPSVKCTICNIISDGFTIIKREYN